MVIFLLEKSYLYSKMNIAAFSYLDFFWHFHNCRKSNTWFIRFIEEPAHYPSLSARPLNATLKPFTQSTLYYHFILLYTTKITPWSV
jgi:hypothetical protein